MKDAVGESVSVRIAGPFHRRRGGRVRRVRQDHHLLRLPQGLRRGGRGGRRHRPRRPGAQAAPAGRERPAGGQEPARRPITRPGRRRRYTEASLIKELEDREIGRPSTYASIIGTILDRGYVFKKGTALVPSFVAFAVVNLLERHFTQLVDYEFTASMEEALDEIASGEAGRVPWLRRFYFGADGADGHKEEGLKDLVSDLGDIDARDVSSFPLAGTDIVIRVGRYGPYLERDDQRVNVPEGTAPDELTPEFASELFERPSGDKILGTDPGTGRTIVARAGRFGPYVTEVLDEDAPVVGQAEDRVAAQGDGPGQRHARRGAAAAHAAADDRRDRRRARDRAERPLRPVRQEGHRQPVAGVGRAAVHADA